MNQSHTAVLADSEAKVKIDKYGVMLTTTLVRGAGNSISIPMNKDLANVTIRVLHQYLMGLEK